MYIGIFTYAHNHNINYHDKCLFPLFYFIFSENSIYIIIVSCMSVGNTSMQHFLQNEWI